jgi:hypothetical protein
MLTKNIHFNRTIWQTVAVTVVAGMLAACGGNGPGGNNDPGSITQAQQISECGGFNKARTLALTESGDYCAAELLNWQYDEAAQKLTLTDARAELNCCGARTMVLEEKEGVYVVTETDGPDNFGRCTCMCVFDLRLEAQGIASGVIPIRIVRNVTDSGAAPAVIFEGELDLSAGAGSVVISDAESFWCDKV